MNGDWFTFETSKVDTCLVSSMVTTLGAWKDRFFWVSESIVPFKMIWRHPDAVLNEPEPSDSELNCCFLKAIRELANYGINLIGIWFENTEYVSVPNVKGFTKTAAPKTSTRRSIRRMSKGPSGDVEKEKNLIVLGKKKSAGRKVVVTSVQDSPSKALSEDEIYVPNWGVKVGDSFKDVSVCAGVLANFVPPGVQGSI
ncbi:hypothetical protein Hanom_Chr06g00539921 [Helianthus anomalus]